MYWLFVCMGMYVPTAVARGYMFFFLLFYKNAKALWVWGFSFDKNCPLAEVVSKKTFLFAT